MKQAEKQKRKTKTAPLEVDKTVTVTKKPRWYRLIRILEYVGTRDFLDTLRNRGVKWQYRCPNGIIREAYLKEDLMFGYEPAKRIPEEELVRMTQPDRMSDWQRKLLQRLVDKVKPKKRWPCPYCGRTEAEKQRQQGPGCWYCTGVEPIVQEYERVLAEDAGKEGTF